MQTRRLRSEVVPQVEMNAQIEQKIEGVNLSLNFWRFQHF